MLAMKPRVGFLRVQTYNVSGYHEIFPIYLPRYCTRAEEYELA